jgi:tetratricopeptide (TPR) repeat protein
LDGIPLAIELAAARARAMSVEAISTRLGDRFRLLVTGDQTVLPRQRTLRALIDWSYDLLTERERALFQCLSVFAGGWTLEAAEGIGKSTGLEEYDVIDLLTQLVEKSLVSMDADGARYRMLDTVRHYAQEKLDESGNATPAFERHFEFYLELAEKARPELAGPQQGTWLARLDVERENLLAAHARGETIAQGVDLGLRLVFALRPYWLSRGLLMLGYRVTVEALARVDRGRRDLARCRGLADAGLLCYFMARYAEAKDFLTEALAIAREIDNTPLVAGILQPLGMACLGIGDSQAARAHLDDALALARRLGNKRELAAASNALAQIDRVEGRLDAAEPLFRDVVALARELGDQGSIAVGLLNLAMVSIGRGTGAAARPMLLEVLSIGQAIGFRPALQSALEVCCGLAASEQDWTRAARLFGAAEAQATQTGLQRDPADEAFLAPLISHARLKMGDSAYAAAETAGRTVSIDEALNEARAWLAGAAG